MKVFRRGCLKGPILVHRNTTFRKCKRFLLDCNYCNRLRSTEPLLIATKEE